MISQIPPPGPKVMHPGFSQWMELSLWNGTWNTADGTPNIEQNMEHGGWKSHNKTEHGTRRVELPLCNGTWNMAGGTPIVERNMEHSGRNSHCGT